MVQAHADRPSDNLGDTHETLLPSTEATGSVVLDNLNPRRFRPYSRLLVVLLFILLYVYISLVVLMITGYLDRRTFDIDKIGLVSTVSAVLEHYYI
jgi:hypothetical protein